MNILENNSDADFSEELKRKTEEKLKDLEKLENIKEKRIKSDMNEREYLVHEKIQESIEKYDPEILIRFLKNLGIVSLGLINRAAEDIERIFKHKYEKEKTLKYILDICNKYLNETSLFISLSTLALDIESLRILKSMIEKEEFYNLMRNGECKITYDMILKIMERKKQQIKQEVLEQTINDIYESL